jgi:FkbM family methyltransferase
MQKGYASRTSQTLDGIHRLAGRSRFLTSVAVKVRNQCEAVIGAALADGIDPVANGELWLIRKLTGSIKRFIDVGANVGDWTRLVLASNMQAEGLCFEPAPSVLSVLQERARSWPTVRIRPSAVADVSGSMQFIDYGEKALTSGEASVVEEGAQPANRLTVPLVTLDDECAAAGWSEIDLLKIDAEGNDWRVLRGARRLLQARAIRVVQFEYGAFWIRSGGTLTSTISFLESCGYSVFRLRHWGLSAVELTRYREYFRYSNYVALRSEDTDPTLCDCGVLHDTLEQKAATTRRGLRRPRSPESSFSQRFKRALHRGESRRTFGNAGP